MNRYAFAALIPMLAVQGCTEPLESNYSLRLASPPTKAISVGASPFVIAVHANPVGSANAYSVGTGAPLGGIVISYRVGSTTYLPTAAAIIDATSAIVVLGQRYITRVMLNSGSSAWVVDAGYRIGLTTYPVTDVSIGNGHLFASNLGGRGRIVKRRLSDGAEVWSIEKSVTNGVVTHQPVRLSATGNDLYVLLGNQHLQKLAQSTGVTVWSKAIPLTTGVTTWSFGDLTASAADVFVSNLNPSGTVRRFRPVDGALVGQFNSVYRASYVDWLPTHLSTQGQALLVVYGNRYLASVRPPDGALLWLRDAGVRDGVITWNIQDIASVP